MLSVFPDSVAGHVQTICDRLTPLRCGSGLAPVVGDFDGLATLDFGNAVARPFDGVDDSLMVSPLSLKSSAGPRARTLRLRRPEQAPVRRRPRR